MTVGEKTHFEQVDDRGSRTAAEARLAGVTRLAPSPTGALHVGNARTFLVNWALARREGWRIVLRIEDLDTPRTKAGAAEEILRTFRWLGIDWDEGPLIQTEDLAPCRDAARRLASAGLAYPCALSRKEIEEAASAPHESRVSVPDADSHETPYPPSLRPAPGPLDFDSVQTEAGEGGTNWRFALPEDSAVAFDDGVSGPQRLDPARTSGDFVLWTKRDQPSYQLACVVDDHRQGVTRVVRGADLLDSTARQVLLYRALGLGSAPGYFHLPLVVGPDGRRLAKRHGDTRLDHYRQMGVPAEAVIGLIGAMTLPGLSRSRPRPMSASEFMQGLRLDTIPKEPIVFGAEDDAWLRSQARSGLSSPARG